MVNDWTAAKECLHDFKKTLINEFHQNFKICLPASHKLCCNTSGFIYECLYSVSHNRILFFCRFPFYNTIMLNLVVCWKSKLTLYCCSQWISRTITAPLVVLVSKHTVLHMYLIYSIAHMCSYWTASVVLAPVVEYQSILLRGTFSTQTELAKTNEPKKQGCSDCCAHTVITNC